jgi:hypothetical protein
LEEKKFINVNIKWKMEKRARVQKYKSARVQKYKRARVQKYKRARVQKCKSKRLIRSGKLRSSLISIGNNHPNIPQNYGVV